ncbi:hypothetical protein [Halomarina pelagica]|uniref:hypothetical protein n=1 Tax=Halomarina pelagica TaxID=2961599 RepID=UPI0020C3B7B9|nr:hypothetical protein [Halomarina sp. BND7]
MRTTTTETLVGISRGIGITELLHGQAPWIVIVSFTLVTQLGDVWFLFLLGGVLYIGGEALPRLQVERSEGLFIIL